MKRINKVNACFFIITIGLLLTVISCSDKNSFVEMISTDNTKPDPVKDYKVANFNGGAYITYNLPKADNILYVKAEYYLNDNKDRLMETRSSYFSDTTTVEGFKEAKEYEVTLTVVSRANVASDPISIKINPQTPVYQLVAKTLTLNPDFQGVRIQTLNVSKKNVGIVFLDDITGKYTIRQQTFSDFPNVSYAVRGYDTIPKTFAAYVTDKWGNRSDTIYTNIKPLYEKALNRKKFYVIGGAGYPGEAPILTGYPLTSLWDTQNNDGINPNTGSFWHTTQDAGIVLPLCGTFGLGVSVKLSRFKYTPRVDNSFIYNHGQVKIFTLWGSELDRPAGAVMPLQSEEGTKVGDWINMGNYVWPNPPSGAAPTALTDADKAFFQAGVEFEVPFSAPKVKALRISVSETWTPGTFTEGGDIALYGDDR